MTASRTICVVLAAGLILLVPSRVTAYQCPPDWSAQRAVEAAKYVYLIRATNVEYAEALTRTVVPDHDVDAGVIKLSEVSYDLLEVLKGDGSAALRLIDPAGIGVGFVGFVPGYYYIIAIANPIANPVGSEVLDDLPPGWPANTVVVSICDVVASAASLKSDTFQAQLARVRSITKQTGRYPLSNQ
ncbi:MAG: hypothetical protein AAGC71_08890 [Pseudomonadota bacterium]